MKPAAVVLLCLLLFSLSMNSQELRLYELDLIEAKNSESFAFVSLSDSYQLSDSKDSLAIPDLSNKKAEDVQCFKLDSKYRKRFFERAKISENDILFAYDYAKNVLVSMPVKNLDAVACLSPYIGTNDSFPYTQYDYMIGFRVKLSALKGFTDYLVTNLVYVGKASPFIEGELKPVIWKKIAPKEYPSKSIDAEDAAILGSYVLGNCYKFETAGLLYYIQDFLRNDNEVFARRLLVLDSKTKKNQCEKIYMTSEGCSLAPLAFDAKADEMPEQWTGRLLKNKPGVIFGFTYMSFGCEGINFLNQDVPDLYISCDNRH
ncbi:MAG TPA: oxidoreductase [Flavobacterium sp.]|nr:oxidoreductase [Flavobacterium sp.]